MDDRHQAKRQEFDPVGDEDVEEEGQRQRDDEERVVRNVGLDQVAQRLVTKLEDGLDPAGLTRAQLRSKPECDSEGGRDRDGRWRSACRSLKRAERAAAEIDGRVVPEPLLCRDHALDPLPDADPDHDQLGRGYAATTGHTEPPTRPRRNQREERKHCHAKQSAGEHRHAPVYARLDDETVDSAQDQPDSNACADKRVGPPGPRRQNTGAGKNQ